MAKKNANDRLIVVKHKPGIKRKRRLFFITGVVVDCDVCRLCVDIVKLPLKPLQFVQPRSSVSHFRQLSIGL